MTAHCRRCGARYPATSRTAAFTILAWHMRMVHYPEWGMAL